MSAMSRKSSVALCVLAAFVLQMLFVPGSAFGKYRDNSDQLPGDGMSTGTAVLLVAAGACLVVATVLIIKHHNSKPAKDDGDKDTAPPADSTSTTSESSSIGQAGQHAAYGSSAISEVRETDMSITPYVGFSPAKCSMSGEKMVVAGVVIGF